MTEVRETLPELGKEGAAIRDMFSDVAPRYDFLNHLLSGSLDHRWRAAAAGALQADGLVLDLCSGTGDQAIALHKRGVQSIATDFCVPMLALASAKHRKLASPRPTNVAGDALRLPYPSGRFAGATVAFGLRNVAVLDAALIEIARTLEPGGGLAVLEFAVPTSSLLRQMYLFYFRRILPLIGRMVSSSNRAYSYLPESVLQFPQRNEFLEQLDRAGFEDCTWKDLTGGIVCLYLATRSTDR